MKIFLFILFISINFILIFKVNPLFKAKIMSISYGIGFVAVPILMLTSAYLISILKIRTSPEFQQLFIDIMFTLMVIIFLNLFILLADVMLNSLLDFQKKNNTQNISINPVRFALYKESGIKFFFRIAFFLGSILMCYGIWLDKK